MRQAGWGSLLLIACATSEGVAPGGPAVGGGPSGGGVAGTLVAGAGGAAGTAGSPSGGAAGGGTGATGGTSGTGGAGATGGTSGTGGAGATGGTSGTGGAGATGGTSGTGGAGATGGTSGTGATGGTSGTGATGGSGGTGGTGATGGSGGTGGTPACAIQGCTTGTESMSGCNAARTIGRKTASVSPYYTNTATTCTSADKSTGYNSASCWDYGRDHIYRIFLRKGDSIDVNLTAGAKCSAATSWDRVFKIYGASSCSDTTCSQKIFCAATGSGTYTKSYTATSDGWHFLVVDGRTAINVYDDSGSYGLTVKLTCAVSGCEC